MNCRLGAPAATHSSEVSTTIRFGLRKHPTRFVKSCPLRNFPAPAPSAQMSQASAQTFARLVARQKDLDRDLQRSSQTYRAYVESHEEEMPTDSASPVVDAFIADLGHDAFKGMTNFSHEAFLTLWSQVEQALLPAWTLGRGRRHKTTAMDALFMALVVLKHYDTWAKHAADFRMQTPTFEKMVTKVWNVIEEPLLAQHMPTVTMRGQQQQRRTFSNYPYALYALDVKFQPAYRPSGRFGEQMRYFSGKHKLYGYKIECAVVKPGVAIHVSRHYPGSASDLSICGDNADKHRSLLAKDEEDRLQPDYGEGISGFPDMWAVLVDKGYQGIQTQLRGIYPTRKPRGGELTRDQLQRNRRVSSDRVLVENYFGRLSMLWRVMFTTFTWSEAKYDQLVRICVALTNFHVTLSPLRADDQENYGRQLARYASMAERQRRRRAADDELEVARRVSRQRTQEPEASPARSTQTRRSSPLSSPASPALTTWDSQVELGQTEYAESVSF